MIKKSPIRCPNCGRIVAYQEDLMFCYLPYGLKCPYCGATVIESQITW